MSDINKFEWQESFNIGVAKIDEKHQQIIEHANSFFSIQNPSQNAIKDQAIKILEQYADSHFTEEEQLMELVKYPHIDEQKSQHQMFMTKIEQFKSSLKEGKLGSLDEISIFTYRWLIHHINFHDQKIGDHIAEQLGKYRSIDNKK